MKWIVEAESIDDIVLGRYSILDKPLTECRDCEHYYFADNRVPQEQMCVCDLDGDRWRPDSFCSYGERREDE